MSAPAAAVAVAVPTKWRANALRPSFVGPVPVLVPSPGWQRHPPRRHRRIFHRGFHRYHHPMPAGLNHQQARLERWVGRPQLSQWRTGRVPVLDDSGHLEVAGWRVEMKRNPCLRRRSARRKVRMKRGCRIRWGGVLVRGVSHRTVHAASWR